MKGLALLTTAIVLLVALGLNENPIRISADPSAPFVAMAVIVGPGVIVLGSLLCIGNAAVGIRRVEYDEKSYSRIWSLTILPAMLAIAVCIGLTIIDRWLDVLR